MFDAVLIAWLAAAPGFTGPVLNDAYGHLRARRFEEAIAGFERAISMAPVSANVHKDLAYMLLKTGETEAARENFREGMHIDPNDHHAALEFGFLAYETGLTAESRRVFDRVRKTGDPESRETAGRAYGNIDGPLVEGIARWKKALETGPPSFSVHYELAKLAEQRDDFALAASHYEQAWRIRPELRGVLVPLARCWLKQGRVEDAHSALIAASRAPETRTAEEARALLFSRYPYVYEFRTALALDPANAGLRRELAYLLLEMGQTPEAETEFAVLVQQSPGDLLSAAQLGFLLLKRKDTAGAMPLLEKVLRGSDEALADRVRSLLGIQQQLKRRAETPRRQVSAEAKLLAEKSYKAGYLKDAAKYFQIAHELDPVDYDVILKLGWTHNLLHQDKYAVRWFDLARRSPDDRIADEAERAHRSLKASYQRVRLTAWMFPQYSSRWRDVFAYGQIKTEVRLGRFPFRPYLSLRLVGDLRGMTREFMPLALSENSAIPALGVSTPYWHGLMLWGEAGPSWNYRSGRTLSDYRGGLAFARGFGHMLGAESSGAFFEVNTDAVFLSRFQNDTLLNSQQRLGYTLVLGPLRTQWFWNLNVTTDLRRQAWANSGETGPGVKFRLDGMPQSMYFTLSALRGRYLRDIPEGRTLMFNDLRAGVWYAFSR